MTEVKERWGTSRTHWHHWAFLPSTFTLKLRGPGQPNLTWFFPTAAVEYILRTSSAKIKSKAPMLTVGHEAVACGGSLPGCEASLPQTFSWWPLPWAAALFVEAGRGRAPLGQSEDLDLLQNWGESLICTQDGPRSERGLLLLSYFLLSSCSCPPPSPLCWGPLPCSSLLSPRALLGPQNCQFFFFLWFSATFGVAVSRSP